MQQRDLRLGRYTVRVHDPIRVAGRRGCFALVSIVDELRVEVVHVESGRSRIVPVAALRYVAPSSRRGRAATRSRDAVRLQVTALTRRSRAGAR